MRASLTAGGRQRLVAEQMLRHLSDPVQSMRDTLRQHSESGLDLRRHHPSPSFVPLQSLIPSRTLLELT